MPGRMQHIISQIYNESSKIPPESTDDVVVKCYYSDVIMGAMVSLLTSLTIVYSTLYSGADERKHQSSASLVFLSEFTVTGEFHKGPIMQKMLPFDDVIIHISAPTGCTGYWTGHEYGSRIVGGMQATPGTWVYQIRLLKDGYWNCGGSILSPQWIISASHCTCVMLILPVNFHNLLHFICFIIDLTTTSMPLLELLLP